MGAYANCPSVTTMKSRFPKRTSVGGPADAVTIHPRPKVDVETCKRPLPGTPTVDVFEPPMSKFVFMRLAQMVCSKDTKVYTGSGGTSLLSVRCCSCYRHLVCSRGYKQEREEKDAKSLVK